MIDRHDNPIRITRRAVLAAMAGGAATLAGCGGGAGGGDADAAGAGPADVGPTSRSVAGISSGGTGSFATGVVTGLGSIILRGIRYDDSTATVARDDDGVVGPLRPGMVVSVRGSGIAAASTPDVLPSATAMRICYASEWVGKVDAVDTVNRTLTVLGQRIDVANAIFDGDALQLSAVTTAHSVEVHGYLDLSTGRLLATRVELSNAAPAAFRLSGQVSALDTTARTFTIGTAVIGYDAGLALPTPWVNGQQVRVTVATTPVAGTWQATRIKQRELVLPELQVEDHSEAEVEGTVTSVAGPNAFTVNGIAIDATAVSIAGALAIGATVEVRGTTVKGAIVASRVEIKTLAQVTQVFEFIGTVSNLNILTRTFSLKGMDFTYGATARIDVLGWLTGATPLVRVKATQVNGVWVASEVRQA
jgi:hypothetical protein